TLNPGHETADKPARRAHLDHRYHRAILLEDDEGTAQISNASHGAPSSVLYNDDGATPSSFPIASVEGRRIELPDTGFGSDSFTGSVRERAFYRPRARAMASMARMVVMRIGSFKKSGQDESLAATIAATGST